MEHLFTALALSTPSTWSGGQTHLTPNALGSGNLPGSYTDLVFTLGDANWTSEVHLPAASTDKASVRVVSNAQCQTQVLQANTDVPVPALALACGQSV
jgi:hypothetical protein